MCVQGSSRHVSVYGQYSEQLDRTKDQQLVNNHEQKLVFIGMELDKGSIVHVLDDCLVTDDEALMGQGVWSQWRSLWDSLTGTNQ